MARLTGFDLRDLELPGGPARNRNGDEVAPLLTDQRLPYRRLVGELVLGRIGLRRAHDHVLHGLVGLLVLDVHSRADRDRLGGHAVLVDHRGRAQLLLELRDLLLEHCLLVLRVVVFGVLADVAELTRLLDPLGHFAPPRTGEVLDLGLYFLEALWSEDDVPWHKKTRRAATIATIGGTDEDSSGLGAFPAAIRRLLARAHR